MKRAIVLALLSLFISTGIAQNTRVVRGIVQNDDGGPIVGATVVAVDEQAQTTSSQGGAFELRVSPYAKYVEASFGGYLKARIEIDGSFIIFRLKVDKKYAEMKAKAEEEARARAEAEKEAAAKAKAEEQARIAAEAAAKAKAEEQARIAAEKEAAARAKAEEQARIAAEKEAAARAKAEEQARIAADKEAAAKAKAEEQTRIVTAEEAKAKAEEQLRIATEELSRIANEAAAKAKAEKQARIAAEKEAAAKAKAEEQARIAAEKKAASIAKESAMIEKSIAENISYLHNISIEKPITSYTALGDNYYYGRNGKEFSIAKAFLCYNLGAKSGEAEAFSRVALYYETGRTADRFYIEQNINIAIVFYKKAASLNVQGASQKVESLKQKLFWR